MSEQYGKQGLQFKVCGTFLGVVITIVHPSRQNIVSKLHTKVPCECITGNIARPECYIFHNAERERWFIVAVFLASAALNDSKWALRSKLPPTMLSRCRGKTGEPL